MVARLCWDVVSVISVSFLDDWLDRVTIVRIAVHVLLMAR